MTETRSDAYGYNDRSELTNAVKNATLNEYAYQYDDIGNREISVEPEYSFSYTANELNQYTQISAVNLNLQPQPSFTPTYDADGNQTLVQTKTGIWSVTYNGENRPVRWERIEQSEQSTNRTILEMKFDRMGRRVEYIESVASSNSSFIIQHSKFVYDGYLCIQRLNGANNSITELFEWDPTEKVATRPMFMQYRVPGQTYALFYTHDGNKNVSEVVHFSRANGVAAHYEYAPFGEVTAQIRQGGIAAYDFAALNPWRFSSEYADDASATVYYNYRHYEPVTGRWMSRDALDSSYEFVNNTLCNKIDILGLFSRDATTKKEYKHQKYVQQTQEVKCNVEVDGNGCAHCIEPCWWEDLEGPEEHDYVVATSWTEYFDGMTRWEIAHGIIEEIYEYGIEKLEGLTEDIVFKILTKENIVSIPYYDEVMAFTKASKKYGGYLDGYEIDGVIYKTRKANVRPEMMPYGFTTSHLMVPSCSTRGKLETVSKPIGDAWWSYER